MDNILLLNSGGSVVQLDTMDSGPCPPKSKRSKQIVKYSGFRSQIKGVLLLKLFSNMRSTLKLLVHYLVYNYDLLYSCFISTEIN